MATGGYNIKEDCMLQGQAQFLFFHPKGQRNNNLKPNWTLMLNQSEGVICLFDTK